MTLGVGAGVCYIVERVNEGIVTCANCKLRTLLCILGPQIENFANFANF